MEHSIMESWVLKHVGNTSDCKQLHKKILAIHVTVFARYNICDTKERNEYIQRGTHHLGILSGDHTHFGYSL